MEIKIKAYLKAHCGWSRSIREVLRKHELIYQEVDVAADEHAYKEMVLKSGQELAPCVEINGVMLADVSGEEVENYLQANGLIGQEGLETVQFF